MPELRERLGEQCFSCYISVVTVVACAIAAQVSGTSSKQTRSCSVTFQHVSTFQASPARALEAGAEVVCSLGYWKLDQARKKKKQDYIANLQKRRAALKEQQEAGSEEAQPGRS